MQNWDPQRAIERSRLELLAEYSTDMIAQVSKEGYYTYVSPSAAAMFQRPVSQVVGKSIYEFVLPEDRAALHAANMEFLESNAETMSVTLRALTGDGRVMWIECNSRRIGDPALGADRDSAVLIRDVDERKKLEDRLREQAMVDGLTGLANRRVFDERIAAAWAEAAAGKTELTLLLLDIDHFKSFNDQFGHQTGDDALRAVAQALMALSPRPQDCVARYGGEEIAAILPGIGAEKGREIAERACATVAGLAIPTKTPTGEAGIVTVSIGVATAVVRSGGTAEMPQALIASADRALYQAKANGRNRIETCLLLAVPA